ncbi:tetratricopeptide repeat protein, partial [Bacteroides salyersiae]
MNKELYHKIIMLGCLFLLITSSIGTNNDPLLPEDYAKIVQEHFANEEWEEGKTLLEEGLGRYPKVSDLQWLMGKYWHHKKDYDQARYHLIKAIEDNYNNVNAKQLLVDVEENTQNYSSAICYVNELLEVNPYWRGLWRRKIDLYRKQGNDVEADRLLKRINQIYPNDTILRKDYIYSMELGYQHMKKGGNRKEAINTLTELIKAAPGNEQYYLDIINLQLQEGNQEAALGWASNGLSEIPGSYSLISKKVGILGELARYPEALVFMRDQMRKNNSAALRQLYNHILLEAAQAERQRDPYVLYGIVYDNGKNNKEALDYLLNTSVTRGYSDDAFYYLREAKKKYGDTDKGILYKEYLLYRKMNEKDRAFSTLNKLYELYPDDYDILLAICEQHMEKAERLIELGLHAEALPHTQFIIQKQVDSEITGIAWERALGCYISMKKYNEALAALDTLTTRYPEYENGIWKRAFILDKMDKTAEALDIYLSAIEHSGEDMRMFYVIGYEELAIPYIKKCMEAGNTQRAHDTACKLVQLNPSSDLGLRYAINTSALLKQYDKFQQYTEQGLQYYPNEPFYQTKLATIYDRDKQYDLSIGLLHPIVQK